MRRRLSTLDASAWQMVAGRESEVALQLLLAGAVKHSQLLGDFMLRVYAATQCRLEPALARSDWRRNRCTPMCDVICVPATKSMSLTAWNV